MKIKELLSDRVIEIIYRTYEPNGQDMLTGWCKWDGSELLAGDHDSYSVDDEFDMYEYEKNNDGQPDILTIWYKSRWV